MGRAHPERVAEPAATAPLVVRGDRNARHIAATAPLVVRGDRNARRARRPKCPSCAATEMPVMSRRRHRSSCAAMASPVVRGDPNARRGVATPPPVVVGRPHRTSGPTPALHATPRARPVTRCVFHVRSLRSRVSLHMPARGAREGRRWAARNP